MSYGNAHYDELFADIDAQARAAKTPAPLPLTGEERGELAKAIEAALEELERAGRTKVVRDRQRIEAIRDDLDRRSAKLRGKP